MAVGASATLRFVVYDSSGLMAEVSRLVNVVSPCPDREPHYCEGVCSKVGGAVRSRFSWGVTWRGCVELDGTRCAIWAGGTLVPCMSASYHPHPPAQRLPSLDTTPTH